MINPGDVAKVVDEGDYDIVCDRPCVGIPCRIFIAGDSNPCLAPKYQRARLSLEDNAAGCLGLDPVLVCFPKVPVDSTNYTEPVSPGCAGAHRFIAWLTEQFKCAVESVCSEKKMLSKYYICCLTKSLEGGVCNANPKSILQIEE